MQIKEQWQKLSYQKKNIYYWISVFAFADIMIAMQHFVRFSQTGECQNTLSSFSSLHSCTTFEFIRNGIASLGVINVAVFIPLIIGMVYLTQVIDTIFAKENQD